MTPQELMALFQNSLSPITTLSQGNLAIAQDDLQQRRQVIAQQEAERRQTEQFLLQQRMLEDRAKREAELNFQRQRAAFSEEQVMKERADIANDARDKDRQLAVEGAHSETLKAIEGLRADSAKALEESRAKREEDERKAILDRKRGNAQAVQKMTGRYREIAKQLAQARALTPDEVRGLEVAAAAMAGLDEDEQEIVQQKGLAGIKKSENYGPALAEFTKQRTAYAEAKTQFDPASLYLQDELFRISSNIDQLRNDVAYDADLTASLIEDSFTLGGTNAPGGEQKRGNGLSLAENIRAGARAEKAQTQDDIAPPLGLAPVDPALASLPPELQQVYRARDIEAAQQQALEAHRAEVAKAEQLRMQIGDQQHALDYATKNPKLLPDWMPDWMQNWANFGSRDIALANAKKKAEYEQLLAETMQSPAYNYGANPVPAAQVRNLNFAPAPAPSFSSLSLQLPQTDVTDGYQEALRQRAQALLLQKAEALRMGQ